MKVKYLLKKFNYILLCSVLFSTTVFPSSVFGSELQTTITDLQSQQRETEQSIKKLQEQRENVEDNVDELSGQSADLQNMYNSYYSQLTSINTEIADVQASLEETSAEIIQINDELRQAQAREVEIYANLKSCMKSSYERGSKNSLILLLYNSKSMQDFLTKTEYVSSLLSYEYELIDTYQSLQENIASKAADLEAKQAALDAYQAQLDTKQNELSTLSDQVKGELIDTNEELADEKDKLKDFDKKIKDLDKKMQNLQSQQAAAQAEYAKKIAEQQAALDAKGIKEDLSGSYAASASELEWLAATIQAEADGESYTGKLAVGTVIMNRVKSSSFPNTVIGVIQQTNQFASYRSGKVELLISRGPNSTCMQAAREVLNGARVGEYLFFMTKYYADYYGISDYTMIGNHAFFKRWTTKTPTTTTTTTTTPTDTPSETPTDTPSETPTDAPSDSPSETPTDAPVE